MLKKIKINPLFLYISLFFLIEVLSYFSLFLPLVNSAVFISIIILTLIISVYRLEYGLLIVLAELFIGSMGRLFVLELGAWQLSLRIALWAVIMLVFTCKFLIAFFKNGRNNSYLASLKNFKPLKYFICLAIFIAIGLINAYLRGNNPSLIFSDFNAWLYFSLLLPTVFVYSTSDDSVIKNLKNVFLAAVIWLGLKTFLLLYVFTHSLSFSSEIYFWLRKTLVGEMTATLSGWPRIFIQGQIFAALGLFLAFWQNFKINKKQYLIKLVNLLFAAICAGVLLISFSRSFWLALILTLLFLLIVSWRVYSWKEMLKSGAWLIVVFVLSFSLLYLTTIFPYPRSGSFNADFISRANIGNSGEAAISSRWSLLPVLTKEIFKEPLLGQGYGATLTYVSNDPRVLEKDPSGLYTTYAFEWGYFDTWLKIGLLGLLAYLVLIIYLLKNSLVLAYKNNNVILYGLAAGLGFIAITNFFTPYLNHPLGIGVIIIGACLINKYRVY